MKRILSLTMVLSIMLTLMSVSAFAAEPYTYEVKTDGTIVIKKFQNLYATEFTVPEMIGEHAVTEIANEAFKQKKSLTSVTIPGSVTRIGERAFSGCINLATVNFPESAVSLGESCFDLCEKLGAISANVSSMGEYVFANCTSLTSVSLGNIITEIPKNTFFKCTALNTIIFPTGLTRICASAFNKCSALETVTFPSDRPFVIERNAFLDCILLTAVTLTPNISVEGNAFAQRADNVYVHNISITCQKYTNAYFYCTDNSIEPVFTVFYTPEIMGDIDADGAVTTTDARITLRIAAQLEVNYTDVTVIVDFDADGAITTSDARTTLRKAANLE